MSVVVKQREEILLGCSLTRFLPKTWSVPYYTPGIEAIEKIRELMGIEIPALLVSGDTDPEKLKDAQSAKIQLLHKPFKPALLRTALNRLINK